MSPIDLVGIAIFLAVLTLPLWATGRLFRRLTAQREILLNKLGDKGPTHSFDMPLAIAAILFGAGALFLSIGLVPGIIWAVDGDADARRVFLVSGPVFLVFVGFARLVAQPALVAFTAEPHGLTKSRFGVRHRRVSRRTTIGYSDITEIHEQRSLFGVMRIRGSDATIRLSSQVTRFDECMQFLRRQRPDLEVTSWRDRKRKRRAPQPRHASTPSVFAVPKGQTRLTLGFLGALLLFFLIWPWFLVTGDHPTRDSFIFMGIGTGLWLLIVLLVSQESFQRHQPSVLELRSQSIAWKTFRRGWQEHDLREIVTVSVETNIIYVRGFPGYRTPVRIGFVDGSSIEIDDSRARHLQASTQQISAVVRAHVHDLERRSNADRVRADQLVAELRRSDDERQQVVLLRSAIAVHPHPIRLAMLRELGDRHRALAEHDLAISAYRAHLDYEPDDATAWEGLAASFIAKGRSDLAGEATQSAERILLGQSQ